MVETSVVHEDATCPRCGSLLVPDGGLARERGPAAGDDAFDRTRDLVQQARGGVAEALNRLIDRYYERVRRSVRPRIGHQLRKWLDSGDILQQAFAKAITLLPRFDMRDEGSFLHWLVEICVRQIHDEDAKRGAIRRIQNPVELDAPFGAASGSLGATLPSPATGPAARSMRREREAALDECLDQLPAHYREVILLRDFDGLEWREVAERMGRNTDSAARELHTRALLEVAKSMRRRGFSETA
jgi:RNA polymerase sigma-70 factor (ECF subfamily)